MGVGPADLDEEAEERQLVPRVQEVGAKESGRVRGERADLAATQHEGVLRGALVVGNAELFEGPRGRAASVQSMPAAVEKESVGLSGGRTSSQLVRLLEHGHVRARPGQVGGRRQPRDSATHHRDVRLRHSRFWHRALPSVPYRRVYFQDAAHPLMRDTDRASGGDAPNSCAISSVRRAVTWARRPVAGYLHPAPTSTAWV